MHAAASGPSERRPVPKYLAHFVVKTNKFAETVAWYRAMFDARVVHERPGLVFLSYDDEHHRIAIGELDGLRDFDDGASGVDHVAFSMDDLPDLIAHYERNRDNGILPIWCINHGPTTSLYYRDPTGVKVELQVDDAGYPGGAEAFFASGPFAENPIGIEFDPEDLARRLRAGESVDALLRRPDSTGV